MQLPIIQSYINPLSLFYFLSSGLDEKFDIHIEISKWLDCETIVSNSIDLNFLLVGIWIDYTWIRKMMILLLTLMSHSKLYKLEFLPYNVTLAKLF